MPEIDDKVVNEVKTRLDGISDELSKKVAERDEQIRTTGAATAENAKAIADLSKEYHEAHSEFKSTVETLSDDVKEVMAKLNAAKTLSASERKTLGQAFAESEEYKAYKEEGFHKQSKGFNVGASLGNVRQKATFTGASLGDTPGYMYGVDRYASYLDDPDRTQFVRSLIPTFGVESGAVEYVRVTGFTNAAGPVPEYAHDDEGEKPMSDIEFEIRTAPIRTVAHWIPATRQIIDDERQLRGYIENRLLYGLRLVEDQQILYGSGTGNELNGILTDPDIQTIESAGGTLIDTIRKAITLSYVEEYRPTGVVLSHQDWETIELQKGDDGHYIWVNVTTDNGDRLWGLPVVSTNAIAQGTVLVGDFQRGSTIHDRENATIRITDSHADFFTKNLWAILAEERLAQTVHRPLAFVEATVTEAPAG